MKAYSIAKTELSSLRRFYESSSYALAQTEETLRYRLMCLHERKTIPIDPDLVFVKPVRYKLKPSYGKRIRQQLLELVFVHLISVLEAYLVDTVRDVFVTTKEPFKDQGVQVNFTQSEILSADSMTHLLSKIINKECRRLTSGGFLEIVKYYRNRFNIDLPGIPPGKSVMTEYHERRHLLVHRLGKPDAQYRRNYRFTGKTVTIDEGYLLSCFDDFESFIDAIYKKLTAWLPTQASAATPQSNQASMAYHIFLLDDDEPAVLDEKFHFWVSDELLCLGDILQSKKYTSQKECELNLVGSSEALRIFSKKLRQAEKQRHIVHSLTASDGMQASVKVPLDDSLILKVKDSLPGQPWPPGIHKVVAQQLGVSSKTVSEAIQVLIRRGVAKRQVNGIVLEN